MGNGYVVPAADGMDALRLTIRGILARLNDLEALDGSQVHNTVQKLKQLINGILEQTEVNVSGSVTAGGNGIFGGTVTATAGITSTGVAAFNVTTLPGGRSAVWIHDSSGIMGQTTSSLRYKTDVTEVPYTAAQFVSVMPVVFAYIAQKDIRDNPDNPNFDPEYRVPVEVGLVAEWLVDAGLDLYVLRDLDGEPKNIDYATFAAHAALVIGRDHDQRLRRLEVLAGL